MQVTGNCFCGDVRFRAEIDENDVMLCHCPDCQHFTGSPYRAIVSAAGPSMEILSGEPTRFVKVREDGSRRIHAFCPRCGAPIFSSADELEPAVYRLRIGTLELKETLTPTRQQWCSSAFPWAIPANIPTASETFPN